jgi:hypothetical protein
MGAASYGVRATMTLQRFPETCGASGTTPQGPSRAAAPAAPITARETLRLIWEAERYPIRGNEDWREAAALEKEARVRAATALTSPDDPPEFKQWLTELLDQSLPEAGREAVMAIHGHCLLRCAGNHDAITLAQPCGNQKQDDTGRAKCLRMKSSTLYVGRSRQRDRSRVRCRLSGSPLRRVAAIETVKAGAPRDHSACYSSTRLPVLAT